MNELSLSDFVHGGVRLTGFSIVDYYNMNTIKMISEITETNNPLNKIPNIPVSFKKLVISYYYKRNL